MGRRGWLEKDLSERWIPAIRSLPDSPEGHQQAENLCAEIRSGWAERGAKELKQQQSLMDALRAAIKQSLGPDHFSLNFVKFTREESFELNRQKQGNARDRQLHQQFLSDPDEIVAKAVRLLNSPEWAEVAAGLAVLTGRRLNEVLQTAEFEVENQWIVRFKGALKRRGEEVPLEFLIPSLTTASKVVEATKRLRQMTPPGANEAQVAIASDLHFADLLPLPHGKTNLYSHLWRSVFCCIATFWYCPKHVDDLLFKAHIMGHFEQLTPEEHGDERKLRQRLETFSSERHYRLYEIADEVIAHHQGQRKGIKLGWAGVEPLPAFAQGMPAAQPEPGERKHRSSLRIWKEDHDALTEILNRFKGKTQQEKVSEWIAWTLHQFQQASAAQPEPIESITPEEPVTLETLEIGPVQETEPVEPVDVETEPIQQATTTSASSLEVKVDSLLTAIAGLVELQTQALLNQSTSAATAPAPATRRRPTATAKTTPAPPAPVETEGQELPERKYRPRGENQELANRAIDAILAHNDHAERHDDKWAITINGLKAFGIKSQQLIVKTLEARAEEIAAHHHQHQIDPSKHNLRHRGKRQIGEVIDLD